MNIVVHNMLARAAVLLSFLILMLVSSTLALSFGKSDELVVPKATKPVKIDGMWSTKTEWIDASETLIAEDRLTAYLRMKYDEVFVYILIDFISDQGLEKSGDLALVCFDAKSDGGDVPLSDDYCFYRVTRTGEDMNGIIQGNGTGWIILQEAESWDPYDKNFDAAIAYSQMNDPYDSTNKHVIYEFRIPIDSYGLSEMMQFYVYVNDGYNNQFVEWPANAGGKPLKLIVKDVVPAPNNWSGLQLKSYTSAETHERPKSPITVDTDKTDYYSGEIVKINGQLPVVENGHEVNIIVKDADGGTFTKLRVEPTDSKFTASFQIPQYNKLFSTGKWTINISYSIWAAKVDINILASEKRSPYSITISEPEVIAHTPVRELTVGDEIFIVTEVKNNTPVATSFVYLVLIKDDFGLTTLLEWTEGSLSANEVTQASILWIPEQDGKYQAEVFCWNDLKKPAPLSESRKSLHLFITLR